MSEYNIVSFKALVTSMIIIARYTNLESKRTNKIYKKLIQIHDDSNQCISPWDINLLENEPDLFDAEKCLDLCDSLKGFGSWKETGIQRELQQFHAFLLDYSERLIEREEAAKLIKEGPNMSVKEASKIVNDFLNGPYIQNLLVFRPGILRKPTGSVTHIARTYGTYDPSGVGEALLNAGAYDYYMRSDAIIQWFGVELSYFYDYLVSADRPSATSDTGDEMSFFAFDSFINSLAGGSGSGAATDKQWALGEEVKVTLEGEDIPGIVLRVSPVEFNKEEIIYMAKKIVATRERANKDLKFTQGIEPVTEMVFGKGIVVSLVPDEVQAELVSEPYDVSIVNIEPSAENLVERMKSIMDKPIADRPKTITGLFYGVPGTGKSALANHIGRELGMKVIKKTYGELQSKYVGEGEKNLHKAFEEAKEERAILLIDEIDSMAGSRHSADRQHQKTFTNQLLTELDDFNGIFFCTSNFMEGLDPAILRRLFLKTEFKFMNEEQTEKCFQMYFPQFKKSKLGLYDFMTPGDLKVVQQAALFEPKKPTIKRIREMVQAEIELKRRTMPEVLKAEMSKSFQF